MYALSFDNFCQKFTLMILNVQQAAERMLSLLIIFVVDEAAHLHTTGNVMGRQIWRDVAVGNFLCG